MSRHLRIVVAIGCAIAAWTVVVSPPGLGPGTALAAEPTALLWRAPADGSAGSVDSAGVSLDTTFGLGLASPLTLDVALAFDAPADAVAVFVGHQRQLWGEQRGLFVRAVVAGGVVVPLIATGVGLGVDLAGIVGWSGESGELAIGILVPAVVAWQDGAAFRLPARLEAMVRTGLGPLSLGLRAGGGLLWGGAGGTAFDLRVGVVVGFGSTPSAVAATDDATPVSPVSLPAAATPQAD